MLRKNTAGQFVHIGGINVGTGAIVTGATWTMRRCLDGTFAAGGATVTEDGSTGFYKVALTQADTNGNNIGYFFTATSCVPVPLNVVTTACDPTSAAFGLSIAKTTNITGFNDIAAPTGFAAATFPTGTVANTTNITAAAGCAVSSIGANVITATSINADAITAAKVADGAIDAATFAAGAINAAAIATDAITDAKVASDVTIASVTGAVGSVAGNVGGNVVGSVASVTAGVTVTTNNDKTGYALTSGERNSVADALLARNVAGGSSSGRIVSEALYTLRNKVAIAAGTMTVYGPDDTTPAFTAAITTAAGNPISVIDPA